MSDNKATVQELQNQYSQLAVRAGHTQYQIFILEQEVASLHKLMQEVSLKAAAAQAAPAAEGASDEQKS